MEPPLSIALVQNVERRICHHFAFGNTRLEVDATFISHRSADANQDREVGRVTDAAFIEARRAKNSAAEFNKDGGVARLLPATTPADHPAGARGSVQSCGLEQPRAGPRMVIRVPLQRVLGERADQWYIQGNGYTSVRESGQNRWRKVS